jgi:hypothetical protein
MSAASAWTMFGQVVDTWSSPDISIWEKLTSTIMTLSMLLPTCVTLMGALKSITTLDTVAKIANVAATIA